MNIYYKKAIGIRLKMLFTEIFRGILPCLLLATAVSAPLAFLVPVCTWGLFVKGGVFLIVLASTLFLFGFNKDEKETVARFLRRKGNP